MAAEINYSVSAMKNPTDPESAPKYYAKMQAAGEIDLDEMAEDIAYSTSLTDGDVLNVLRALIRQMKKHLTAGKIVKMEKFGSFQFQICSKGVDVEKDFDATRINKVNIQFRPGALVREAQNLKTLAFRKVAQKAKKKPTTLAQPVEPEA